jgi:hypothetical protein
MPSGVRLGTLPLATLKAYDPGRRIDARLLTFRARAADQAHAAFTPGTAWPVIGHPPGSSQANSQTPRFRCHLDFANDASTAHAHPRVPGRALLKRLPGPHPTRSSAPSPCRSPRRSSANATQAVWRPPPKDDAGGPTSLHLRHSTAHMKIAYINPPSASVTHGCRTNPPPCEFVVGLSNEGSGEGAATTE